MARASATLPASLITAHYVMNSAEPPFQHYLAKMERPEGQTDPENSMDYFTHIAILAIVATGLAYAAISYSDLKEKQKLLTPPQRRAISLTKKLDFAKEVQVQNSSKSKEMAHKYLKTWAFIGTSVALAILTIFHLDFPVGLDSASLAFYTGLSSQVGLYSMFQTKKSRSVVHFQGIIVPCWIINAHSDIFNFVVRRAQRVWPFSLYIHRIKKSQQFRA